MGLIAQQPDPVIWIDLFNKSGLGNMFAVFVIVVFLPVAGAAVWYAGRWLGQTITDLIDWHKKMVDQMIEQGQKNSIAVEQIQTSLGVLHGRVDNGMERLHERLDDIVLVKGPKPRQSQ